MPMPDAIPVHKRKPLVTFGLAAALGAIAGVVLRTRPGLLSRLKLR
jgi:hypothetical protein